MSSQRCRRRSPATAQRGAGRTTSTSSAGISAPTKPPPARHRRRLGPLRGAVRLRQPPRRAPPRRPDPVERVTNGHPGSAAGAAPDCQTHPMTTLAEAEPSHHPRRRSIRGHGYFKRLGPGIVTGAADDDPSGIGTYSQVGAAQGLSLLWMAPFLLPLAVGVQESTARLGLVTGKGLGTLIRERFPRLTTRRRGAIVAWHRTGGVAQIDGPSKASPRHSRVQPAAPIPSGSASKRPVGRVTSLSAGRAAPAAHPATTSTDPATSRPGPHEGRRRRGRHLRRRVVARCSVGPTATAPRSGAAVGGGDRRDRRRWPTLPLSAAARRNEAPRLSRTITAKQGTARDRGSSCSGWSSVRSHVCSSRAGNASASVETESAPSSRRPPRS